MIDHLWVIVANRAPSGGATRHQRTSPGGISAGGASLDSTQVAELNCDAPASISQPALRLDVCFGNQVAPTRDLHHEPKLP
jgi:hypothetical protein